MGEERILRLSDADLRVITSDGSPSTILLHGFGGDLRTWDRLWPLLPAGRGYIRYDLRGFGESVAHTDSAFHHADDLLELMDALRIERCDLVGFSMGGSIAVNFALARPDRVHSLGLLSPTLTAWKWSDEWRALWRPIVAAARSGDMAQARDLWLAHPLFATTRASDAEGLLRDEIAQYAGGQWIDDRQAPAVPDSGRLHALVAPVLLLTGAHDFADFRRVAELIQAGAPNVSRHDANNFGHMLHLEAPGWCSDMLTAFWDEDKVEG